MNIAKGLSDSITLVGALVLDIESVLKNGGGLVAEGVSLLEVVLADQKVRDSISALVADIKG